MRNGRTWKDLTSHEEKLEACRETGFDPSHLPALLRTVPPGITEITPEVLRAIMCDVVADPRYRQKASESQDRLVADLLRRLADEGPSRVLVGEDGEAVPPSAVPSGLTIAIVFIRRDGFTLGAPDGLAMQAYQTWCREWAAFSRPPYVEARPIDEYAS